MADCRVATDPQSALITYALGSCVALTMYDPVARIGGMLHYMLPDSSLDPAHSNENPFKFADTGIPRLLEDVCALGASKHRLVICAAGAAQIVDDHGVFEIGRRNYLAARRVLWRYGVLLTSEAVGGTDFRTVTLEIGTGRLLVQEAGRRRELKSGTREKEESTWRAFETSQPSVR